MGLFSRVRDAVAQKKNRAYQETQNKFYLDALCSAYENVFAQVRPLVNKMKTVVPYGVKPVGKTARALPVQRTPEIAALLDPNDEMGWAEFADTMFVTWLTEDELNIHAWRDKRGVVYGYSVLPVGARKTLGGVTYFEFATDEGGVRRLEKDEVMTLRYSRNPRQLDKGVSPASAIFAWTQIDDLIAQYQKAYFENGAVPAYITTIRASSREKFEAKKKEMEGGFKGARNRNKTLFIWRQYLDDGSESDEVEVRTIQGNNSTLALKEILEAVENKINKAFGVSNFVMGDDASAKYDNAELSARNFAENHVAPALESFWNQFQHELDRICDGIGYAITYDYDIPELTDREKTRAETAQKTTGTLKNMIESGATPSAAVAALELDDKWLEVADGFYNRVLAGIKTSFNNDKTKNAAKNATHTTKASTTDKASVTKDAIEYTAVFGEDEADAKKVYDVLLKMLRDSINEALEEGEEVSEEAISELVEEILNVGLDQANAGSKLGAENLRGLLAGSSAGDEIFKQLENDGFHVTEEFKEKWHERTERVVNNYHEEVRDTLREALDVARENGVSREELRRELEQAVPRVRAEMIARTETAEAFREGRLETDDYIAKKYDLKIGKVWRTHMDERTCEVCEAMDGQVVELHEAFPDHVETEDGVVTFEHSGWNRDGESPNAHPLCRCDFEEVLL